MIDRLDELNRLLIATATVSDSSNVATVDAVYRQCESIVIESRMPDHEATLTFAERLQFVEKRANTVAITPAGIDFIQLNPQSQYELRPAQSRLLVRTCYFHGILREPIRQIMKTFGPTFDKGTYTWSQFDSPALPGDAWLVSHLEQLGVLRSVEGGYEVAPEYVSTVAEFLAEGKGFTDSEFEAWLQEKKAIGELAEKIILEFEVGRLKSSGHLMESRCVRRISKLRVDAGYDIESYDGSAPSDLNYNRFIEIKGSRGGPVRFFWSENEMRVARKLGARYWIYFQGGF